MMKHLLLPFLLIISSCALVDEVSKDFNILGNSDHPSVEKNRKKKEPEAPVKESKVEILVPSKQFPSSDKSAVFALDEKGAWISLLEGKVSYKEGHSVEAKADGEIFIIPVEATASPKIVVFKDPQALQKKLEDRKVFELELILDDQAKKNLVFNLKE